MKFIATFVFLGLLSAASGAYSVSSYTDSNCTTILTSGGKACSTPATTYGSMGCVTGCGIPSAGSLSYSTLGFYFPYSTSTSCGSGTTIPFVSGACTAIPAGASNANIYVQWTQDKASTSMGTGGWFVDANCKTAQTGSCSTTTTPTSFGCQTGCGITSGYSVSLSTILNEFKVYTTSAVCPGPDAAISTAVGKCTTITFSGGVNAYAQLNVVSAAGSLSTSLVVLVSAVLAAFCAKF